MTTTKRDELAEAFASTNTFCDSRFTASNAFRAGYDSCSFQQEQDKRNYEFAVSECSKWKAMAEKMAKALRCCYGSICFDNNKNTIDLLANYAEMRGE